MTFSNEFSEEIWTSTYKHHSDNSVKDNWRRVAKGVASVEKTPELRSEWEDKFYDMMEDFKVIPAGRILSNAGTEWNNTSMINCFLAPNTKNPDSIEGIMEHNKIVATTIIVVIINDTKLGRNGSASRVIWFRLRIYARKTI